MYFIYLFTMGYRTEKHTGLFNIFKWCCHVFYYAEDKNDYFSEVSEKWRQRMQLGRINKSFVLIIKSK